LIACLVYEISNLLSVGVAQVAYSAEWPVNSRPRNDMKILLCS
jgi:hypothetical protein